MATIRHFTPKKVVLRDSRESFFNPAILLYLDMNKIEMDELLRLISAVLNQNHAINKEVKRLLLEKPMDSTHLAELTRLLKENENTLSLLRDRIPI